MRALRIVAVLLLSLAVVGCAQKPVESAVPAEKSAVRVASPGTLDTLKRHEAEAAKFVDLATLQPLPNATGNAEMSRRARALGMLATTRTFAGDTEGAIAAHDAGWPNASVARVSDADLARIDESTAEDALQAIVAAARTRQIVILNEAHHVSINRAFAMRLARELRKLGFEYLACETFTPMATAGANAPLVTPVDNSYPSTRTGFYSRDPHFGQFLREAIGDRWKFVAYEFPTTDTSISMVERIRAREEGQANNLVERIFRNDPKAKVFIYVGYAHAAKVGLPFDAGEELWMAARLKAKTGIDPLTIDQSAFYPRPDRMHTPGRYSAAVARHKLTTPFVMREKSGAPLVFGYPPGAFDFQVVFPDYAAQGSATSWRESLADRRPVAIPKTLLPSSGRRLIYAFHENEPGDAVPADVVLVDAGKPVPTFMLPKGTFRYQFEE